MSDEIVLEHVTAPTETARLLVGELEVELSANYPAEQRHGLPLDALFQPKIKFYVAWCGKVPAGCGGIALLDGFAELKRMYVRPEFRGKAVASSVLAKLETVARDAGYTVLVLETGAMQHAALRFYEREGFSRCEVFGDYAAMPEHAIAGSIFMRKLLTSRPFPPPRSSP